MIKENKFTQYGFPRKEADIKGITIHETGMEISASDLCNYLDTENKTSQGCHYLVDDTEIVQVMPDDWSVYHTGKAIDWGCKYTIAIEICSSPSDSRYLKAEDNAIKLIHILQDKYHIPTNMIFFHNDFNERTYCPKTLLDKYGNSKQFIKERLNRGSK